MKKLYVASIRILAQEMVGPCSDYQIMFCAVKAAIIKVVIGSDVILTEYGTVRLTETFELEDLRELDLVVINEWMKTSRGPKVNVYA